MCYYSERLGNNCATKNIKHISEKVHESLWKGANQKWNHGGLYRKQRMLYNKEKTGEQVTAAKTRRDAKDEQLKAYLKELGVGIGC